MFKIGLDLGYGYLKGVNERDAKIIMPSLVTRAVDRTVEKLFTNYDRYGDRELYISASASVNLDGEAKKEMVEGSFFIGELAQRMSALSSYAFDYNKILHPNSLVLIGAAAALLSRDGEQIHIVTGPPLKYMKTQKQSFQEVLQNYRATVRFASGLEREVSFGKVTVFPQGAAAVYAFFAENPELYRPGSMMIIEIGFKTTEILSFTINRDTLLVEPLPEMSNTLEIGTSKITKQIADEIYSMTEINLDLAQVEEIIKDGVLLHKGKEYNLQKIIEDTRRHISTLITDNVKAVADKKLEMMNFVCVAGGGARDLFPFIQAALPNAVLAKDPQFLNAKGYLKVAEIFEQKM